MSSVTTNCWYQDCVINGKVVEQGERNGLPSYQVIKKVLNQYKRPFTVLDIGAAQGFFSFMIAHDYKATCVMVEGDYDYQNHTSKLLDLCQQNTSLSNIIFLKKLVSFDFLKNLSDCEHFDVTLALNFVHHSGLNWKKTIDLLVEMGDNLILENPPSDELAMSKEENEKRAKIDLYMQKLGAAVIGEVERFNPSLSKSKIWWLHKTKIYLKRRHVYWPPPEYIKYVDDGKRHLIKSSYTKKELIKKINSTEIKCPWINGINLVTFLTFNGIYPSRNLILQEIDKLKSAQVRDWGLANMIISGKQLHLIDKNDFAYQADYQNLANFIESNLTLNSEIYWQLNQHHPDIKQILQQYKRSKIALRQKINSKIKKVNQCFA